jgi:hypothetical protein
MTPVSADDSTRTTTTSKAAKATMNFVLRLDLTPAHIHVVSSTKPQSFAACAA